MLFLVFFLLPKRSVFIMFAFISSAVGAVEVHHCALYREQSFGRRAAALGHAWPVSVGRQPDVPRARGDRRRRSGAVQFVCSLPDGRIRNKQERIRSGSTRTSVIDNLCAFLRFQVNTKTQ